MTRLGRAARSVRSGSSWACARGWWHSSSWGGPRFRPTIFRPFLFLLLPGLGGRWLLDSGRPKLSPPQHQSPGGNPHEGLARGVGSEGWPGSLRPEWRPHGVSAGTAALLSGTLVGVVVLLLFSRCCRRAASCSSWWAGRGVSPESQAPYGTPASRAPQLRLPGGVGQVLFICTLDDAAGKNNTHTLSLPGPQRPSRSQGKVIKRQSLGAE